MSCTLGRKIRRECVLGIGEAGIGVPDDQTVDIYNSTNGNLLFFDIKYVSIIYIEVSCSELLFQLHSNDKCIDL